MYKNVIFGDDNPAQNPHIVDTLYERLARAGSGPAVKRVSEHPPPRLAEVEIAEDRRRGIFWQYMAPAGRPSFTMRLLKEMRAAMDYLAHLTEHQRPAPFQYLVTASRMPGIYNLGGDLRRFVELIRSGNRADLQRYAHACIDVVHKWGNDPKVPISTIALVQGDALGGGFECALACDVIIAERSAKFGLPEVLFGLFPGMGAYSLLSRRVSPMYAERLILSGQVYTAQEMYDAGVVDVLIDDGEGEQGVHDFIYRERRQMRVRRALHRIRERVNPVTYEELLDVTELWVDTALTLGSAELRKMERFAVAQDRRFRGGGSPVRAAER